MINKYDIRNALHKWKTFKSKCRVGYYDKELSLALVIGSNILSIALTTWIVS